MALTLQSVFDDLMELLDFEGSATRPEFLQARVIRDINAALQVMQAAGYDYFTRERVTVNLTSGTASYDLDADIQGVIKPLRLADGTALMELQSRGEYDLFGPLYLGQTEIAVAQGRPLAYYLDRTRGAEGEDPAKATLLIVPAPNGAFVATVETVKEAPRFELSDVDVEGEDVPPEIPIPHQYVESIFLPIARMMVATCNYFHRPEMLSQLAADDARARRMLGLVDPQTPAATDVTERKKAAARAAAREAYNATS